MSTEPGIDHNGRGRESHGLARRLSVVIPVYRSEAILPELVRRLGSALTVSAEEFELILVNDCSPDGSWEVICDLAADRSWIRPINLMRNYGQHNALLCGIRAARYGVIITMDDDLQHPPEEIPKLLAKLAEGYDVVYGTPEQEQHGLGRDFASWFTKLALQNVMGADIARRVCAFRVFRAQVAKAFEHYEGAFVSIDVLLTWGTNRFASIPVVHKPRTQGASGYTFRKLMTHAMNMMTGFSTMPLQIASWVGFLFTLFGLLVLVYVVSRYFLHGDPVPGFPFLASIVALFSGAQLFALGIIGEYLARMHFRAMQKPPYVVREFQRENSAVPSKVASFR
ncbi:MAG TPA: glycosyltransferase family 2 protein [Candidatus Sulfotelmatobacter sp.]|nr:glycosyltransferase family 2 protein [Candidatus Sulfotelmatobacter sp.]